MIQVFLAGVATASLTETFYNSYTEGSGYYPLFNGFDESTIVGKIKSYLWWSLPDILIILSCIFIAPIGKLNTIVAGKYLFSMGVISVFLLYIPISFLRTGKYRNTISRFLLELPILRFLGYLSYVLYIVQVIFCDYYYQIIVDDIRHHPHSIFDPSLYHYYHHPLGWLRLQNIGIKLGGIAMLFIYAYIVQKFLQDGLVASLYTYFLTRNI